MSPTSFHLLTLDFQFTPFRLSKTEVEWLINFFFSIHFSMDHCNIQFLYELLFGENPSLYYLNQTLRTVAYSGGSRNSERGGRIR